MAARTVTFVSNYSEHSLTRRPHVEIPLPSGTGGFVTQHPPVRYQFKPGLEGDKIVGVLTVKVGQDKLQDHSGWLATGQDDSIERDAPDALRAHKEFGRDIWEQGWAPGTLSPRPQDFRSDLMAAGIELDVDAIMAMLNTERQTHGRGDLINEAEAALGRVHAARAQLEASQAAADAEEKKTPAKAGAAK